MGMASSLCYLGTVLVGGIVAEGGYNHLVHAISELPHFLSSGYAVGIVWGFAVYGWLLMLFSVGAAVDLYRNRYKLMGLAATLLGMNALAGLLMAAYPMDARDMDATWQGQMHIILAAVCAITSFTAPFLIGLSLRRFAITKRFAYTSLIFGMIILVSGGITAAGAANHFSYFGLIERMTIGSFILWVFLFASKLPAVHSKLQAPQYR
jgi:hypothetical protein